MCGEHSTPNPNKVISTFLLHFYFSECLCKLLKSYYMNYITTHKICLFYKVFERWSNICPKISPTKIKRQKNLGKMCK